MRELVQRAIAIIGAEREVLFSGHQVNGVVTVDDAVDQEAADAISDMDAWLTEARAALSQPEAAREPAAMQWRLRDRKMKHDEVWSYVDYCTGIKIAEHPEKYETRALYVDSRAALQEPQEAVAVKALEWLPMETAPKGPRGSSEWFLGRSSKEFARLSAPFVVIRRRAWPLDDSWECNGGAHYVPRYFDAWAPLSALSQGSTP